MASLVAITFLSGCGMSEEQKMKTIEDTTEEYAIRFCNKSVNGMARAMYDQQFDYMLEDLRKQGIQSRSTIKIATQKFEEKVKEQCNAKFPKEYEK
ncbi:MAG TPA: hypothetical protein VD905_04280 [Flavobacteriales bacterium]|nr:hypothetical protein [Flavobacteriales bacterium]